MKYNENNCSKNWLLGNVKRLFVIEFLKFCKEGVT